MIIAIDFDGTCVRNEYPDIGESIGAEPVLKDLVAAGHKLILWTVRSGVSLAEAVRWFRIAGIPLWGINENPNQKNWSHSPKAHADIFIDDRALGCPLLQGYADWREIRLMFQRLGALSGWEVNL